MRENRLVKPVDSGSSIGVAIVHTREALEAAVGLSGRYFPDRCWPDKAVDLMDEAASLVRLRTREEETGRGIRARHRLEEKISGQTV